jgi:hypothetical protein
MKPMSFHLKVGRQISHKAATMYPIDILCIVYYHATSATSFRQVFGRKLITFKDVPREKFAKFIHSILQSIFPFLPNFTDTFYAGL